jgi:arsenate reductase (thioredoxin)
MGDTPMTSKPIKTVLFLCTHNSCRSVIAESILNALGQGRFRALSAGSHPSGRINSGALDLLQRKGYPTHGLRSKTWDEFAALDAPPIDFIFTVCADAAGETCPVWPGHPTTAHWGVADPSRLIGTDSEQKAAFDETHRLLYERIAVFIDLPFGALDPTALKQRLTDIGTMT